MSRRTSLRLAVTIERKRRDMAAFAMIPEDAVSAWRLARTTTVEGTLDEAPIGRRSLVRLPDDLWFIEFPRGLLDGIGKAPGDRATLEIRVASAALPLELRKLIAASSAARACWNSRTQAQRRMIRENVLAAKSTAARERRARRALLPARRSAASPGRVRGLTAKPRSLVVRIVGRQMPGRTCAPYRDIRIGLAQKVGCDPSDTVPADVGRAIWETPVEVRRGTDGAPAFRGPAVNGPPAERFLYLTWIGRRGREPAAMFRRAKLRLDAIPAGVLASSLSAGLIIGRLGLTARDGTPLCGSVRPPGIDWSPG